MYAPPETTTTQRFVYSSAASGAPPGSGFTAKFWDGHRADVVGATVTQCVLTGCQTSTVHLPGSGVFYYSIDLAWLDADNNPIQVAVSVAAGTYSTATPFVAAVNTALTGFADSHGFFTSVLGNLANISDDPGGPLNVGQIVADISGTTGLMGFTDHFYHSLLQFQNVPGSIANSVGWTANTTDLSGYHIYGSTPVTFPLTIIGPSDVPPTSVAVLRSQALPPPGITAVDGQSVFATIPFTAQTSVYRAEMGGTPATHAHNVKKVHGAVDWGLYDAVTNAPVNVSSFIIDVSLTTRP